MVIKIYPFHIQNITKQLRIPFLSWVSKMFKDTPTPTPPPKRITQKLWMTYIMFLDIQHSICVIYLWFVRMYGGKIHEL